MKKVEIMCTGSFINNQSNTETLKAIEKLLEEGAGKTFLLTIEEIDFINK